MTDLVLRHTPQERRYWCGPAAVHMAIAARNGEAPSQWELAQDAHLRTELHHETPDRIVIRETLNRLLGTSRYRVVDVHGPTPAETDRFRGDLVHGIDDGWPMLATMWLRAGGPRPPGYPVPTGEGIKHIVAIHAYQDDGDTVLIADPASRGTDVSWGHLVPPTYPLPIDTLMTLMRGKGYVA